ncbi:MAG: sensor histidine kinase [Acidimicrobiia bacterium]
MRESRSDRVFLFDAFMASALFVASVASLAGWPAAEGVRPLDLGAFVLIAAQTLTLAWRRRFPTAVLLIVAVAWAVERGINYPASWAYFGIALALYTVGAELPLSRSRIVAGVVIAVSAAWTVIGIIVYGLPWTTVLGVLLFLTFPWLVGVESRRREQRVLDLEDRAIRAEMSKEQEAADAVRDERARIARELHDVIAHEMTVMTVQASAAGRVIDTDPSEAKRSMQIVEDAGRRGLTEMRRLLGLLRETGDLQLDPQPGLDSLESLAHQLTDAGLPVEMKIEGTRRDLPVGIDLNAFRIVQESLTNTARHAGPEATADVLVTYRENELEIDVSDDGRGAAENLVSSGHGHGHGLIGMEERVSLLDGSLSAGPRTGGGYRVRATIPIPPQ